MRVIYPVSGNIVDCWCGTLECNPRRGFVINEATKRVPSLPGEEDNGYNGIATKPYFGTVGTRACSSEKTGDILIVTILQTHTKVYCERLHAYCCYVTEFYDQIRIRLTFKKFKK